MSTTHDSKTVKVFGLWNRASIVVKLHREGCNMLRTASRRNIVLDAEEVEDMRERKYEIVACKCTK